MDIAGTKGKVQHRNVERGWLDERTDAKDLHLNIREASGVEASGEVGRGLKPDQMTPAGEAAGDAREAKGRRGGFHRRPAGDQLFLLMEIAALAAVDAQAGFDRTMVEYDRRSRLRR